MEESETGWNKGGTLYFPQDLLSHDLALMIPFPLGPLRGVGNSISHQPLGLKQSRPLFPTCARVGDQANLIALSWENLQLPEDFETGSPAAEGASAARLAGNRSPREGCATCWGGSVIALRVPSCLRMPVAKGRAGTQVRGSGCCPSAKWEHCVWETALGHAPGDRIPF